MCLCGFGYVLGRVAAGTDSGEIFYFGGQQQKKGGISEIARSLLGYRVDTCSHKFMLKARENEYSSPDSVIFVLDASSGVGRGG